MISCADVYNIVLDFVRKDRRGRSLDVDEFNRVAAFVNQKIWADNIKEFEDTANVTSAMAIFKVLNYPLTLVSGKSTLPSNYSRIIGEPRSVETISAVDYTRKVDVVTSEEYTDRVVDYLTQPTTTYPICIIGGYPSGTITQILSYGTGVSLVYSTAHGLKTGDSVIISGTTDYNGVRTITKVTDDTFSIAVAFTSNQTGAWIGHGMVNITVNPVSITTLYLDYLRNIEEPFLDYYINDTTLEYTFLTEGSVHVNVPLGYTYRTGTVGGPAVYVDSVTSDFEWDADMLPKITGIMLEVLGVQLDNANVYQAGGAEEVKA